MKFKLELTQLVLWLIAILTSFYILRDTGFFRLWGPVCFICMLGSVVSVRKWSQNQQLKP